MAAVRSSSQARPRIQRSRESAARPNELDTRTALFVTVVPRPFALPVALVAIFCLALSSGVLSQSARSGTLPGTIGGRVSNLQGNAFGGAIIQVRNQRSGSRADATSASDGTYSVHVPEGDYEISVNVAGMKPYRRDGLVV